MFLGGLIFSIQTTGLRQTNVQSGMMIKKHWFCVYKAFVFALNIYSN